MIVPGSKGWINKYFDLINKGQITLKYNLTAEIENSAFIHAALARTGIVFGFPSRLLFAKNIDDAKWTTEEKLKVLLFESHLFVYKLYKEENLIDQQEFIEALHEFYGMHRGSSFSKLYGVILRETKEDKIDSILTKRVDIKVNYFENSLWINYFNNVFIYLDVILFNDFLQNRKNSTLLDYDEMAMNALTAITLASYSDGVVESQEKAMFSVFLASANLSDLHRSIVEARFDKGADYTDFTDLIQKNDLLKLFMLDLSSFVILSNYDQAPEEIDYLHQLCQKIGLTEEQLNEGIALTEQFILHNQDKIPFLNSSSSVEKVYSNLSVRWIKILGRNKDKLVIELKQSKELVFLIRKSTTTELTREEKDAVKSQFKEIVKSMPSLAIFMLPGGAFLLPLVLKVIPALIPSAFRDNELDK